MRKIQVILLGAMLALGMFVAAAAPVSASCSQGQLVFHKDINGGGSGASVCSPTDVSDLSRQKGPCGIQNVDGWNDCISSIRLSGISGTYVCLWTDANYRGNGLRIAAPYPVNQTLWYNLPSTWADKVSSIEWGSNCLTD